MFCTNCGKQLPDGTRFCIYCGTPTTEAADPQLPVQEEAASDSAQIVQEPVYAAPTQEPVYSAPIQEPVYQEPVYQEPVYQEPIPYIPTCTDTPNAPAPRKKKKTGLIVAIALVLVLAVAGGVVYYIHTQNTNAYNDAVTLLEERDYDGALAAFRDLGSFRDSADQAAGLEELQADYNVALKLLKDNEFDEAAAAFKKLDDYRDSKEYVDSKISYQKALYYKDAAAGEDFSVWAEYMNIGSGDAMAEPEEHQIAIDLYTAAAQLLEKLGDYENSADMASESWLDVANLYLEKGDFSAASGLLAKLNDEDAATFAENYASHCADAGFLLDVIDIYKVWYDENDSYSMGEEIRKAYSLLSPYIGEFFDDSYLESQANALSDAFVTMYSTIDSDDNVSDWVTYYKGMAQLYAIADDLQTNYQVFSADSDAMDLFVGYTDYATGLYVIEQSLKSWWNSSATADEGDDGHYYAEYKNNTGYSFTLQYYLYFYDNNNEELLEISDLREIEVKKGATVYIPVIPGTIRDSAWSYWNMDWVATDIH